MTGNRRFLQLRFEEDLMKGYEEMWTEPKSHVETPGTRYSGPPFPRLGLKEQGKETGSRASRESQEQGRGAARL